MTSKTRRTLRLLEQMAPTPPTPEEQVDTPFGRGVVTRDEHGRRHVTVYGRVRPPVP